MDCDLFLDTRLIYLHAFALRFPTIIFQIFAWLVSCFYICLVILFYALICITLLCSTYVHHVYMSMSCRDNCVFTLYLCLFYIMTCQYMFLIYIMFMIYALYVSLLMSASLSFDPIPIGLGWRGFSIMLWTSCSPDYVMGAYWCSKSMMEFWGPLPPHGTIMSCYVMFHAFI